MELTDSTTTVTLSDGSTAPVTIKGDEIVIDLGMYREGHTVESLTNNARAGRLPTWVKQIPSLHAAIDARFSDERKAGLNPHERISYSDGRISVTDTLHSTTVTASIVEVKRQFETTGHIPRAFQSKKARLLLGLPLSTEARHA